MGSSLRQRLRRSPPDVVYTPIDVTSPWQRGCTLSELSRRTAQTRCDLRTSRLLKNGVCPDSIGAGSLRVSLRYILSPSWPGRGPGGWSRGLLSSVLIDHRVNMHARWVHLVRAQNAAQVAVHLDAIAAGIDYVDKAFVVDLHRVRPAQPLLSVQVDDVVP